MMHATKDKDNHRTANEQGSARLTSNLASPPSSVASKRRKSVDEGDRQAKKTSIAETEEESLVICRRSQRGGTQHKDEKS